MIHQTFTDPTTPLGHLIRARREVLGLSQGKLALMVGFDHSALSRLETGSRDLHPSNIPTFAAALDVSEVTLALAICRLTVDDLRETIRAELLDEVLASVRDAVARMQPECPVPLAHGGASERNGPDWCPYTRDTAGGRTAPFADNDREAA